MPDPQPAQMEQRMKRDRNSYDKVDVGRERGVDDTRPPTADLGDDGELVASLRGWQVDMPDGLKRDLAQAADRLILYREALEAIRAEPPVNYDSSINADRIIRLVEIANAALTHVENEES